MPTAFPNISGNVFSPNSDTIQEGFQASRNSERKRIILPVHRTQHSLVQRLYNFLQPGTYIQPHLHPRPHASESICLLLGSLTFFVFKDDGSVSQTIPMNSNNLDNNVIDLEPNIWHSFIVHEEDTLIFETKMGPYSITEDKVFAPWAPAEFTPESEVYLEKLYTLSNT